VKIVHITPHLGGGVGRVLLAWLGMASNNEHSVYCLEHVGCEVQTQAENLRIMVFQAMGEHVPELLSVIACADIVVIHWWNHPAMYKLLVNETFPPCRIILWSHISGHVAPQIFTKALISFPDRFVVSNPWSLETSVIQSFTPAWRDEHVRLIFSCAGTERGERAKPVKHDCFTIGYVGTVDYCKLHQSFLRMSAAVRIPEVNFVVCGGESYLALREEAQKLGVGDIFLFTGPVKNVSDYLGSFDVFGYPLRAGHYGTGEQAIIEAMAAGLPVVVLDNGSEGYIVKNNVTGLVADNEMEYTHALEMLYHNKALRIRLGEQARKHAVAEFSLSKMVANWQNLLDEAATLKKRSHKWQGKTPLNNSEIFIESMGETGNIFNNSIMGNMFPENADHAISVLQGAHRAATRGSVFHYRSYYPEDPFLNLWCGLLEENMGAKDNAIKSFTIAYNGGIERSLQYLECARKEQF
jgi:L-malate glycosyltransferase